MFSPTVSQSSVLAAAASWQSRSGRGGRPVSCSMCSLYLYSVPLVSMRGGRSVQAPCRHHKALAHNYSLGSCAQPSRGHIFLPASSEGCLDATRSHFQYALETFTMASLAPEVASMNPPKLVAATTSGMEASPIVSKCSKREGKGGEVGSPQKT